MSQRYFLSFIIALSPSNIENIYAASGKFLYVWNAIDGINNGVSVTEVPYEKVNMCSDTEPQVGELCYIEQPKPTIVGLLLHGKQLVAIVSGDYNAYSACTFRWPPKSIVYNTTILVYDISSIPSDNAPLKLLAKSDPIVASYNTAQSIGNKAVIVVTSDFNMKIDDSFLYKFYRDEKYCDLNSTEYTNLAEETALNETETFLERMWEELQVQLVDTCESIVPVRFALVTLFKTHYAHPLITTVASRFLLLVKDIWAVFWSEQPRCQE